MTAQIVDISGRILDETIKRDLSLLCDDLEKIHVRLAQYQEAEQTLEHLLASALRACGLHQHETERLFVQVTETGLSVEYKVNS
jgi:hypothetical protein